MVVLNNGCFRSESTRELLFAVDGVVFLCFNLVFGVVAILFRSIERGGDLLSLFSGGGVPRRTAVPMCGAFNSLDGRVLPSFFAAKCGDVCSWKLVRD